MRIYIWKRVDCLTDSYHNEGGCAVIAEDLESARKLLPENCEAQKVSPDADYEIEATEAKVYTFPDSGCC